MEKKDINKLDGATLEPTIIESLVKTKDVVRLMYWGGAACDLILKDSTYVTVYINGVADIIYYNIPYACTYATVYVKGDKK